MTDESSEGPDGPPLRITVDEDRPLDRDAIDEEMDRRRSSRGGLTATSPDPRIFWGLVLLALAILTWGVYHGTV